MEKIMPKDTEMKCQVQKMRKLALREELREKFVLMFGKAQNEIVILRQANEILKKEKKKLIEEGAQDKEILEHHKVCETKVTRY